MIISIIERGYLKGLIHILPFSFCSFVWFCIAFVKSMVDWCIWQEKKLVLVRSLVGSDHECFLLMIWLVQLVRETTIQCLVASTGLPYSRIYPLRSQVVYFTCRKLKSHFIRLVFLPIMSILCCTTFLFLKVLQATLKALDDHKRIIRQEAVRCRQAWSSFFLTMLVLLGCCNSYFLWSTCSKHFFSCCRASIS